MGYRTAIAIWLLVFCGMLCAIGLVVGAPQLLKLSNGYRQIPGTVVAALPNSHGTILVRYRVEDKTYDRKFGPSPWPVGAPVTVYYSTSDAAVSALGEPRQLLLEQAVPAVPAAFIVASAVLAGIIVLVRGWRLLPRTEAALNGPRATSSGVLVGVVGGAIAAAIFGRIDGVRAVGGLCVVSGAVLFAFCAWRNKIGWEQMLGLRPFWIASTLAAVGVVINNLAG